MAAARTSGPGWARMVVPILAAIFASFAVDVLTDWPWLARLGVAIVVAVGVGYVMDRRDRSEPRG